MSNAMEVAVYQVYSLSHSAVGTSGGKRRYLEALTLVSGQPDSIRYKKPWVTEKKGGGEREIVNASESLGYVQYVLGRFLRGLKTEGVSHFSVLDAVRAHQASGKRMAVVFDLKNAYNSTTRDMVFRALRKKLWWGQIRNQSIELISDLVTYKEVIPLGCGSSKNAFNIVAEPLDELFLGLYRFFKNPVLTRYEDDYCLSFDFGWSVLRVFPILVLQVRFLAGKYGFGISRMKMYSAEPFDYLGTRIFSDRLELDPKKIGDYLDFMSMVLQHPEPKYFRSSVNGISSWAIRVAGEGMPDELFELFYRYYNKIGHQPSGFSRLVDLRGHGKFL